MDLASQTATKPVIVGGLSYAGLSYILGEPNTPSRFLGIDMDNRIALALSFAGSSFASEAIKNQILPWLPGSVLENQKLVALMQPLITGATGVAVHGVGSDLSAPFSELIKIGGIGALSEIGAQMVEQRMYPGPAKN